MDVLEFFLMHQWTSFGNRNSVYFRYLNSGSICPMKDFWTAMAPDLIISALSFVAVLFVVILLFLLNTMNMNNPKPSPSSLHNSKPLKKKDLARKAKNKTKADKRIRRNLVEVKSPQPVKKMKDNSKPLRKNDTARTAKNKTKVDKRIQRTPVEAESSQPVEKIVEGTFL